MAKTTVFQASHPTYSSAMESEIIATDADAADMARLGKAQLFHRTFSYWSTFGFVSIYLATWEYSILSMSPTIPLLGFGGFFWTVVGCTVFYASIVLSLAEMASMSPTAGGQYHWVSEFAGPYTKWQKGASYAAGWMSTLGWIASYAGGMYALAELVQVIVELAPLPRGVDTDSVAAMGKDWQLFLVTVALLLVMVVFNTAGARILPALEVGSLVGHTLGWIAFLGVLWGMCSRKGGSGDGAQLNSAREVFSGFENNSGWEVYGAGVLVSQVSIIWSMLGSDTIVHIAEEVQNASLTVPRAMWYSYVLNAIMAFVLIITMLFCIGPLDALLDVDLPYLNLFANTGSTAASLFLAIVLLLLLVLGNITALATTSREVWAFARDKGFPFSGWISHISQRNQPNNAVILTTTISLLLCIISLGSSLAFSIIVSLSLLALMSTYSLSIGCVLLRRLSRDGPPLPPARWSLGKWGLPINAVAVAYSVFIVIMSCFPAAPEPDAAGANWAPLIWVAVIALSFLAYAFHGRKHFTPPFMFIEGVREEGMGFQKVD